jgi:phospholipid/cholesterol/gamma-HCH transport system substrate-binding protein
LILLLQGVSEGKGLLGSLVSDKGKEGKTLNQILDNLVVVTEEAKTSASSLTENMEALKHNWLFKSYFEERGYSGTKQNLKINLIPKYLS